MTHHARRRAGAILLASLVLVAACGDDDSATVTDSDAATSTTATDHDHAHDHGDGVEVGDTDFASTVTITAEPDSKAGVNLRIETTDFSFAPEHASGENVLGEGHAHVYVDGEKVARAYGPDLHLGDVSEGEHEIRVELNANDHQPLVVDGSPVEHVVTVRVPASEMDHAHDGAFEAADPAPSVSIEIAEDAKAGYNVHVETTDFSFTPEKVGDAETVSGEGHAHLYVDGTKVARLYGGWYHLDGLEPGEHEIRVGLNANDHSPYVVDGEPIEASTSVTVEGAPADSADAVADTVIEVDVRDGEVVGGGRQKVALGDSVIIRVTSDVTDHVHLHGYDVMVDVAEGETADLAFDATIPGVFEVELEDSGIRLLELEVS